MGVPITVAGSIVALDNIAAFKLANHAAVTLILVLLLSYLMISKIQIKKI
jgi:CDP-diacylglycerol--serine O-phosphatidyltransferase